MLGACNAHATSEGGADRTGNRAARAGRRRNAKPLNLHPNECLGVAIDSRLSLVSLYFRPLAAPLPRAALIDCFNQVRWSFARNFAHSNEASEQVGGQLVCCGTRGRVARQTQFRKSLLFACESKLRCGNEKRNVSPPLSATATRNGKERFRAKGSQNSLESCRSINCANPFESCAFAVSRGESAAAK